MLISNDGVQSATGNGTVRLFSIVVICFGSSGLLRIVAVVELDAD